MRFEAMTGIFTASFRRRAANVQAARGTFWAMVGTRASCQPMPWLMMSAPAASTARASADDLLRRQPALDQVDRGHAKDDEEILARPPPHGAHDLDGKAQAVLQAAAPAVGAVVGARRRELVDEVALRAHDLDAVVAGLARQRRGRGVVVDGAQDVGLRHAARNARIDRRGDGRRPDVAIVRAVAAGVQDLQDDLAARARGPPA